MIEIDKLNFDKLNGLIPGVVVDASTGQILMLGFFSRESLQITLDTKKVTFFSRSKNRLWTKGEISGNYLTVKNIIGDCDDDSIIVYAEPAGPTCHTGNYSCFGLQKKNPDFLKYLFELIKDRKLKMPEGSYTTKLFRQGENRIIQKVGEEAVETVIAAKNHDKNEIINEVSDLVYHLFVMLADQEIELDEITENLRRRHKPE